MQRTAPRSAFTLFMTTSFLCLRRGVAAAVADLVLVRPDGRMRGRAPKKS